LSASVFGVHVERLNAPEGKMVRSNIRDRNILFLCHNNGSLSFIAEAIARQLLPPKTQVFSARLKRGKIDPKAVEVLREIGINVSTQDAKGPDVIPTRDIGSDCYAWEAG